MTRPARHAELPGTLQNDRMIGPHAVVIGASAGGVAPLLDLIAQLPGTINAAVGVVVHIGNRHSLLPELLVARGASAMHPRDGQPLEAGRVYVAPPDHHMTFTHDQVKLSRGPLENHARPAVDPLFRSTAIHWGDRAIGVVLSGALDDGTAGLAAIKQCGGIAIVQDPATAIEPSMPSSALHSVEVDHCLDVPAIAKLLHALSQRPGAGQASRAGHVTPPGLLREHAISQEVEDVQRTMENLSEVAKPSALTCPGCGGGLWELNDARPLRYRCHTGHAYTAVTLERSQGEVAEQALWSSVRALRERELLLRRLADVAEATGDAAQAAVGRSEAERVREQAQRMTATVEDELQHARQSAGASGSE